MSSSSGATPSASPVVSNRLRNVLITAVVCLLLTFIYLSLLTIPFFKRTLFVYAPLLLWPHLWMVWRLRKRDQKRGLEWAAGTGVSLLAVSLLFFPIALSSVQLWVPLLTIMLAHAVLVCTAIHAYRAVGGEKPSRWAPILAWLQAVGYYAIATAIIYGFVDATLIVSASDANEAIIQLYRAQREYSIKNPEKGFAATLEELGPAPGADLIKEELARGKKKGYRFKLVPDSPDASGRVPGYRLTARPAVYGWTGKLSFYFYSDESGVIRRTRTKRNRLATPDDPPAQ